MYNDHMNIFKTYFAYLRRIWSAESEGFGDTFAKVTKTFGIKPCWKCEKRRKNWNARLAYKKQQMGKGD